MKETPYLTGTAIRATRRQVLVGTALAIFDRTVWPNPLSALEAPTMKETPAGDANAARTSLHQETEFSVPPARLYHVLLSSKEFAAFTGMAADIDAKEGGAFATFGGLIVGRNIELVPSQRIVQAWRRANWEPGVYSLVKFELKPKRAGTLLLLDHTGFPPGDYDHLYSGWGERYWDPLHKYLA